MHVQWNCSTSRHFETRKSVVESFAFQGLHIFTVLGIYVHMYRYEQKERINCLICAVLYLKLYQGDCKESKNKDNIEVEKSVDKIKGPWLYTCEQVQIKHLVQVGSFILRETHYLITCAIDKSICQISELFINRQAQA